MGTKKKLAPMIASYINEKCDDGAFLDLFSGMCSVGHEVSLSGRQVWSNDAQSFAYTVATQFFTSQELPNKSLSNLEKVKNLFNIHSNNLTDSLKLETEYEKELLVSQDLNSLIQFETSVKETYSKTNSTYSLFTNTYSCTYISMLQAIEIDSLRFAFDQLLDSHIITIEQHNWYLIALGQALGKITTSTGHFAQYLGPKESNLKYYCYQRRRSIYKEWVDTLDSFLPVNSKNWRKQNLTFNEDANKLLSKLKESSNKPSVIYADPPYTLDQYSRYYHLYETLIKYDYPETTAKARYRTDRFKSSFSQKSTVKDSLELLVKQTSELGSSFILSYPENSLIPDTKNSILNLLEKYFKTTEVAYEIPHLHSTMGSSKGQSQNNKVNELIFYAR